MSTVAEIIEAVKELPETEKGVLFRELDPLREPEASRGSLARMRVLPDTPVPVASTAAAFLQWLPKRAPSRACDFSPHIPSPPDV